jgi:cell division GTPase FtsZ
MSNTKNISGDGGVFGGGTSEPIGEGGAEDTDQGIDMSDIYGDYDSDIGDILIPPAVEKKVEIKDKFDSGFKFAFIGSGQGGSRIAETFSKIGYGRVCAINTAQQDLDTVNIPNKLNIGGGGAGKNPAIGARLYDEKKEDVLDFMKKSFGEEVDRIVVCAGGGGGTGAGSFCGLVKTAYELQRTLGSDNNKVGGILALPKRSEGAKVNENAYKTLTEAWELVESGILSPLILIDNEKIGSVYPGLAVDRFWQTANLSTCSLFHLFNTIVNKKSHYSSFDAADYKTVLDSGLMVLGATNIKEWKDETDISYAVRDNLKQNILAGGVELASGDKAAACIIGSQEVLNDIPQDFLDYAFEQFIRLLQPNSTVHRGIYRGSKPGLNIFTTVGGIGKPTDKLRDLKSLGNID